MSTMVAELYAALRKAGVEEPLALTAAQAVFPVDARNDLVTKADLTAAIADLKADLIKWNVGAVIGGMAVLTAIFSAIVRLSGGP